MGIFPAPVVKQNFQITQSDYFQQKWWLHWSTVAQSPGESAVTEGNRRWSWSLSHRITLRWRRWKRNVEPMTGMCVLKRISKDGQVMRPGSGTFSGPWKVSKVEEFTQPGRNNEDLLTVPQADMGNLELHISVQKSGLHRTCGGIWAPPPPTEYATAPPNSTYPHPPTHTCRNHKPRQH